MRADHRQARANRRAAVLILTGTVAGILVGAELGKRDAPTTVPVTATRPAWADGCTTDADCAAMERSLNDAGLHLTGGGAVVSEDSPGWNCLTDGNRACGPQWVPVTTEHADALAEGDDAPPANADTRDWESCLTDGVTVVCPDGYVEVQE